jgi:membrane-bound lytic murein transglycosylase F
LRTGELIMLTRNNAHCFYYYRDEAMGFEYDLVKAFTEEIGVRLAVKIADRWEQMIPALLGGEGHLVAASMTITPQRQRVAAFSQGYLDTHQHIIVHRDNAAVRRLKDLEGHRIHMRQGTSYQEHLETLRQQGMDLELVLIEDIPTEELIRQVAQKQIAITIADNHIALLNRRYYPQTRIADAISPTEQLGWAVRPKDRQLLDRINRFFDKIKANGEFDRLYEKYYSGVDLFDYVNMRDFHRRLKTKLPRYRPIIETAARQHGFDWRLIAAQMYQESQFEERAQSHGGALGLMQLTPSTATSLGVKEIFDVEENIEAGVAHLKNLYKHFAYARGRNRLYLALAAYNIGQGHILDAQNIARKKNLDPNQWSSLVQTLPLLRYRQYHQYALYGYCRGTEPIEYVKRIQIYYDVLKHQAIRYPAVPPA